MIKVPFKKLKSNSSICGNSGCQYCKYEKRWNKRNNKQLLERNRVKLYELKLIKEQLEDDIN